MSGAGLYLLKQHRFCPLLSEFPIHKFKTLAHLSQVFEGNHSPNGRTCMLTFLLPDTCLPGLGLRHSG